MVTRREVAGTANDPPWLTGAGVDLAPPDRLAVGVFFFVVGHDLADDERAVDVRGRYVNALDLEPGCDETRREVLRRDVSRHLGVVAQPRQGCAHQTSRPNGSA